MIASSRNNAKHMNLPRILPMPVAAIVVALLLIQAVLASTATNTVSVLSAKSVHHYVFFGMDRERIKEAKSFLETPAFEGAQIAYSWRQLEQGKDNYDFSLIREDLAVLK